MMNVNRATISFLIAALVPGTLAIFADPADSPGLISDMFGFTLWYVFSVPVVFCLGFATLFVSLKIKYGPIFVPPLVGSASGMLIAKASYMQGMNTEGFWLFTISGLATAVLATLIYFGRKQAGSN